MAATDGGAGVPQDQLEAQDQRAAEDQKAAAGGADGVVCVTISSALSATYEAARLAAESVAGTIPVRVVDSRAVSMGEGTVAIAAAELAAAGESLDDVAAGAAAMVPRTRTFAALDTLDNLRKGGRIGAAFCAFRDFWPDFALVSGFA